MTIRKILTIPNTILREKSLPVKKVDHEIKNLMDDMLQTMYHAPGIGLAAIQIGVPKRVVVMDLSKDPDKKTPMYFINPEITWKSKVNSTYEEGCLSIPEQFAEIERPASIEIEYTNEKNEIISKKKEGYEARILQHEIDHLSGKLFFDYLSSLKRNKIIKRIQKLKKLGEI